MPSKGNKRKLPEHNTPPNKGKEKKTKENETNGADPEEEVSSAEEIYCDRCTEKVDQLIQCERCEMWLCNICEGIPDEVISFASEFYEFRLHWYCKICDKAAVYAARTYSQMSNSIREDVVGSVNKVMVDSLNQVVNNFAEAIDKVQESFVSHCKSLEAKITSSFSTESAGMDTSSAHDNGEGNNPRNVNCHSTGRGTNDVIGILDEIEDRNRRKCNLLIYNLPEPTGTGTDTKTVKNLVKNNLSISGVEVNKVTRLGKHKENSPRPILVTMADETSKWKCLKQAPKLRKDTKFSNVYISPDLTLKERQENKKLYLELKSRREKGEKDLMIKRGKIVTRTSTSNQQSSAKPPTETTSHQ